MTSKFFRFIHNILYKIESMFSFTKTDNINTNQVIITHFVEEDNPKKVKKTEPGLSYDSKYDLTYEEQQKSLYHKHK